MNEKLLHFIWQFQYYNKFDLQTEDGEDLKIEKVGLHNINQGADFSNAAIKINNITLHGNIEIHVNSSDWLKHHHNKDTNYNNTILHVVWNNDKPIYINNKSLHTLVLENRVPKILLERYIELMTNKQLIACENYLPAISNIAWFAWQERLVVERLQQKSEKVLQLFTQTNNSWEDVLWQLLASNFGIKVNATFFEEVAKTIPVNILAKHKNQIHQLEALLLGQANLLSKNYTDDYAKLLFKEYSFYQTKYKLKKILGNALFLRMRPSAFPTVRLAQLAMLVKNSNHLFSKIKQATEINEVKNLLNVTANDYWHYHYKFDELTKYYPKTLGNTTIDNICINTIIPVLFSYGLYKKEQLYKDKAVTWVQKLNAEKNSITKIWEKFEVENKNALQSQALIHLYNNYCKKQNCLNCRVGNKILQKK